MLFLLHPNLMMGDGYFADSTNAHLALSDISQLTSPIDQASRGFRSPIVSTCKRLFDTAKFSIERAHLRTP